jgi:hypothetical protein
MELSTTLKWSIGFFGLACVSALLGFAAPLDSPAIEQLGDGLFLTWIVASLVSLMCDQPANA